MFKMKSIGVSIAFAVLLSFSVSAKGQDWVDLGVGDGDSFIHMSGYCFYESSEVEPVIDEYLMYVSIHLMHAAGNAFGGIVNQDSLAAYYHLQEASHDLAFAAALMDTWASLYSQENGIENPTNPWLSDLVGFQETIQDMWDAMYAHDPMWLNDLYWDTIGFYPPGYFETPFDGELTPMVP